MATTDSRANADENAESAVDPNVGTRRMPGEHGTPATDAVIDAVIDADTGKGNGNGNGNGNDSEAGRWLRYLPRPTPKNLITFLITLILVVGEARYGIIGGYEKLALTLGTCVLTELALARFLLGTWAPLQSAYISGVSLTMLVRPQSGLLWPFALGAALSIGSKYVLRLRGRHLWNPSNFGLAVLFLLAPAQVAPLSHEFGNDLAGNAVIWGVGLLVASRARVLHISVVYALSFAVLAAARSAWTGAPLSAELAPLTGPMYQLLVFFMLTDPRTTVRGRSGQIATVVAIALLEAVFRLANDFDLAWARPFAPAPPIIALAIVGPLALAWQLSREAPRARLAPARGEA